MPAILLIGENPQDASHLARHLCSLECEYTFATSYDEALALLRTQSFILVLSPVRVRGITVFPLIDLLEGTATTLFYSQRVEDGYWWMPALQAGVRCFGSSALRPPEFVVLLDAIIEGFHAKSQKHRQTVKVPVTHVRSRPEQELPSSLTHGKPSVEMGHKVSKKMAG